MEALDIYTGELVKVPFYTPRFVPSTMQYEKEDHFSITEQAYVPPQVQIADMMIAGLRLAEERRARFDSTELNLPEEEDIPMDPLREPGIDLVDVQRAAIRVSESLRASQEKANREIKEAQDEEQKKVFEQRIQEEIALRAKNAGV
jgi:hypothetical protein